MTQENISSVLAQFLHNGTTFRTEVLEEYIGSLRKLIEVVKKMDAQRFRFYSTSLLLMYEGDPIADDGRDSTFDLKMIDFAHTFPFEEGDPDDDGYLFGLEHLLRLFQDIHSEYRAN